MQPFKLERYFAQYEFATPYLLSSSDCEGLSMRAVLALADDESRGLWDNLALGYTESQGLPLLRQEVAGLYQGVNADHVLIVVPEEGIFVAMHALLRPGDHVVCTFPGYQSLYALAESMGCGVTYWQPVEEQGWRFDPDFLESAIQPNTRLVVCNFPHNPTGYLPPQADWQRILEIVSARGLYLFADEMYRYLEQHVHERLPAGAEVYERAISLFGLSKAFGMAGVRLGWLVTREQPLLSEMAAMKDYTTICNSAPSEILALIALRAREQIIGAHQARLARNLALLDAFVRRHADRLSWVRPCAGTVCFPRLLGVADVEEFCRRAAREVGVMLLPSTVYDYDNAHIRIGFGRENLPEGLARFAQYLEGV